MAPPPWTVCKYYLSGRCNRPRCKYRHTVAGMVVVNQCPPQEEQRKMAVLVDGHIKATFAAGIVPVTVEDMRSSKLGLRIENVSTSITLKWSPRTRTLLLRYDSESQAFCARTKLIGAILANVSLNCALDEAGKNGVTTLRIFDLPWRISSEKVLAALPPGLRPGKENRIQIEPRQIPNLGLIRNAVTHLTKFEPICVQDCSLGSARKVKLWFTSRRLDGVARMLDGQRLQQLDGSRIHAMETVEVQLVLGAAIYERYRGLLKSCAHSLQRNPSCNIHFDERNRVPGAPIQVIISGTDRQALMVAKAALDKLLIRNTVGRLCPTPKLSNPKHRIVLAKTTDFVNGTEGGGLRRAQNAFGEAEVYLEYSVPPAIVVWGNTYRLRQVQRYLSADGSIRQRKEVLCEVCWDECDDFIRTEVCRHVACKTCFVQYCTLTRDNKFPLRCFQTNCTTLLPVHEVRLALGEDAFHRLASEAIETFFRQETAYYIKCPGPDCSSYFSVNGSGTHICPTCFTTTCRDCKVEYHFGESCSQYQERLLDSDNKLEKWMEAEGAKHCPSCNAVVERASGCNHMTCAWCEQHFCFTCLEMFPTGQEVYQHMTDAHAAWFPNGHEENEANARAIRLAQAEGGERNLIADPDRIPNRLRHLMDQGGRLRQALGQADRIRNAVGQADQVPPGRNGRLVQAEIDEQLAIQAEFEEFLDEEDFWDDI